jgi:hypothetical protein
MIFSEFLPEVFITTIPETSKTMPVGNKKLETNLLSIK